MHTQKVCINYFMNQLKLCSKCKESKAHSEFDKRKSSKDGLQPKCKVCKKECDKIWRRANREHVREYNKNWNKANAGRSNEHKKEYHKKWYEANKDYKKEYYQVNKERKNEYYRHKYATDPEYRAKCILRTELRKLFKLSGLKREKRSMELLGVSWAEAYNRLLKTLPEGYTEQNWLDGKLHVDHKIPVSWYERLYGTITEDLIKRINHISNLQLLPVNDNLSKSNKYGHGINNEIILYEGWVITEQLSTVSH